MVVHHKHLDVLIAALICVGAIAWFGMISQRAIASFGDLERLAVLFVGAFAAAQVSRRLLVELELGATVIAALVAVALVLAMVPRHRYATIDAANAIPVAVAVAGATVGAVTSRRRNRNVRVGWHVVGGGFAGLGAAVLTGYSFVWAVGIDPIWPAAIAILVGGVLGTLLVGWRAEASGAACALGLAIVLGTGARDTGQTVVEAIAANVLIGALIGSLGGAIGSRCWRSRKPAPDLPAARVH